MELGFHLGTAAAGPAAAPEAIRALVQTGDAVGLHSVWISDHVVIPTHLTSPHPYAHAPYHGGGFTPASQGIKYDCLATLPYVAGLTRRLRVGTSVMVVPMRNPLVVGKWIATLDQLSGGRLLVGVGVGWLAEEFDALAQPHFAERGALTDEYIRVWKALWSQQEASFSGRYYQFAPVVAGPKPVQRPHPPIYVGGHSRPALRRAAELGDGWQAVRIGPDEVGRGIETLRALAARRGRNPDDLAVSVRVVIDFTTAPAPADQPGWNIVGDTKAVVAGCQRYRALGVALLIANLRADATAEQQQAILARIAAEVAPELAER